MRYAGGIVQTLTPVATEHRRLVGMLNHFVKEKNVPRDLARRLRLYFDETSHVRYYEGNQHELLITLTNELRGETSLAAARKYLSVVSYLSSDDLEKDFFSKAALALTSAIFCPRELVGADQLSIVVRGMVAKGGRIGIRVCHPPTHLAPRQQCLAPLPLALST